MISLVLLYSLTAALLVASLVRAALPGHLLHPVLGRAWAWWLLHRPGWPPVKPTGDCVMCTCFWLPGLPAAVLCLVAGGGWLSPLVMLFTGFLSEFFMAYFLSR